MARRTAKLPDPRSVARPWIDEYPPGVPPDYPIPHVSLPRLLDDAVRDFPESPAVTFEGATTTWAELGDHVALAARVLVDLEVEAGTRVGVVLPNEPAIVVVLFALWRLGAVAVPFSPHTSDEELGRVLTRAGASTLIGDRAAATRLAAVAAGVPGLQHVVACDLEAWRGGGRGPRWRRAGSRLAPSPSPSVLPAGIRMLEDTDGLHTPAPTPPVDPESTAVVLTPVGQRAPTRSVLLRHRNLVANAFQARLWLPDLRAGEERLLCLPSFAHAYGLTLGLLAATLSAASMVLPDRGSRTSSDLLSLLRSERPTLLHGSPSLYAALAADRSIETRDLASIRACVSPGALPAQLVRDFEARSGGARLRGGHGLTEAGPLTHANPIYGRVVPESIGLPVTGTIAIVVDADDPTRQCEFGDVGELAVHGPQVMQGYLDDPLATDAVLRDGWLLTGQLVTCDDRGVFRRPDRHRRDRA